ncbi:MAG: PfkB family carbohydrate kinase, partial [Candidatus Diapherotrites archaeon]|nr:PfkB family carbohydrate kinase [Candidatus Diapherotrites archaeon]
MSEKINVVVLGSIALDDVKTPYGEVKNVFGGSGTFASFASSFFQKTGLLGAIGEDFPKEYLNLLEKHGINLDGVQKVPGPTMHWEGEYEKDINI